MTGDSSSAQAEIENALREQIQNIRDLFDRSPDPCWIIEGDKFVDCNLAAVSLLGYPHKQALLAKYPWELSPPTQPDGQGSPEKARAMIAHAHQRGVHRFEWVHQRADRSQLPVEVTLAALTVGGKPLLYCVWRDLTEKKQAERAKALLEEQLQQSQKLEALGLLAGGIAHDFNNLLSVILGYLSLMRLELGEQPAMSEMIEEMATAGDRAASLTRQLLAFSRRQAIALVPTDLHAVLSRLEAMLRRVIGEDVALEFRYGGAPAVVRADASQIEQLVVNLAVNARDAMPQGGSLIIETADVQIEPARAKREGVEPGTFLALSVKDSGEGIPAEFLDRIFEPFFTTKAGDRGTGLGLAMVFAAIRQHGGFVSVDSERAVGTTFTLHFPRPPVALEAEAIPAVRRAPLSRGERVMLVEDEESLRRMTERVLSRLGYQVSSYPNAALALASIDGQPIELLLTDVVLPGINGRELAERMRVKRPGLRVLYVSGYTDQALGERGVLAPETHLILKPYRPEELAIKIRQVLDGPAADADS